MKRETLSPTIEALLKARALIETSWCQGFGYEGRVCAVEALWKVDGAQSSGLGFLVKALPAPWTALMYYNDDKATTKADILALYDRAIDLALKAEG